MRVFISYSHKDERFKDELCAHLSALKRQLLISTWEDRNMAAGSEWEHELEERLSQSYIVILLVSSDFIKSDYCYKKELRIALEKHKKQDGLVVPVIIRHCEWKETELAYLKALPKDGKPISSWKDRDEAWVSVAKEIREAIPQFDKTLEQKAYDRKSCDQIEKVALGQEVALLSREFLYNQLLRDKSNQHKILSSIFQEKAEAIAKKGQQQHWIKADWDANQGDLGVIVGVMPHWRTNADVYVIRFLGRHAEVYACSDRKGFRIR